MLYVCVRSALHASLSVKNHRAVDELRSRGKSRESLHLRRHTRGLHIPVVSTPVVSTPVIRVVSSYLCLHPAPPPRPLPRPLRASSYHARYYAGAVAGVEEEPGGDTGGGAGKNWHRAPEKCSPKCLKGVHDLQRGTETCCIERSCSLEGGMIPSAEEQKLQNDIGRGRGV